MRSSKPIRLAQPRAGFTLVELLVTILIIAIMSTAMIAALGGVRETARQMRTQQFIMRLSAQIMPRYHSYKSRQLPVNPFDSIPMADPTNQAGNVMDKERLRVAWFKLWGIRALMTMEMPDCFGDLMLQSPWLMNQSGGQSGGLAPYVPNLRTAYIEQIRFLTNNYTDSETTMLTKLEIDDKLDGDSLTNAECLYLIIESSITDRDLYNVCFNDTDVADVNQNGLPEFVDAWGRPIKFIRWPAGFVSPLQPMYRLKASANVPGTTVTYASVYGDKQPYDPLLGDDAATKVLLTRFPVEGTSDAGRIGVVGGNHDAFDPLFVDRWEPSAGNVGTFENGRFSGQTQPTATAYEPPQLSATTANKNWGFPERSYNLVPLIVSAGSDGFYGMSFTTIKPTDQMVTLTSTVNPYLTFINPYMLNTEQPRTPNGEVGYYQRGATDLNDPKDTDNIHNHRSASTTGL